MRIFKENITEEEQELRHAQKSSAWSEFRLSVEGFRPPTQPEVRRSADEFKSELVAGVQADERALQAARDRVVETALECSAFQLAHGEGADNGGLPPLIAETRRLSNNLKETNQ
ncbi:MAG: hypothetical protein WBB85_21815 [Albidovulum sp.]|uniref:hypothetical protein n=1 Tax=Albidovulum sp. TaxID=1872424 RepID=UPI003CA7FE97